MFTLLDRVAVPDTLNVLLNVTAPVFVSAPDSNVGQEILDFIKYFSPEGVGSVLSSAHMK